MAGETWRALLEIVSGRTWQARSMSWSSLPPELRERHSRAPGADATCVARLREHSTPVIEAARTDIRGVHLSRAALLDESGF